MNHHLLETTTAGGLVKAPYGNDGETVKRRMKEPFCMASGYWTLLKQKKCFVREHRTKRTMTQQNYHWSVMNFRWAIGNHSMVLSKLNQMLLSRCF